MKKQAIIALGAVAAALLLFWVAFAIYAGGYYRASDNAKRLARTDGAGYTVSAFGKNIAFVPNAAPSVGLVFYPGGKVEHTAYAPLMAELAKRGVLCVLVRMPRNLAVFDMNAADSIIAEYPQLSRWYVGGHSLGGAVAASHVAKHAGEYAGLVLLGAYSAADLSGADLKVVSVYGSEDGVLSRERYSENRANLPAGFAEKIIAGGCHSYFGDYGAQKGDGTPTISREEQIALTAEYLAQILNDD